MIHRTVQRGSDSGNTLELNLVRGTPLPAKYPANLLGFFRVSDKNSEEVLMERIIKMDAS